MAPRRRAAGTEMYNTLRSAILNGSLRSGDYLDGTPALRKRFGISNDTAQRVLVRLAQENLIIRRNGSPTRVAALPPERRVLPLSVGLYLPRMGGAMNEEASPMHFQVIKALLDSVARCGGRMPLFPAAGSGYDFAEYGLDGLIVFSPTPREKEELTMLRAVGLPLLLLEARDDCWEGFNRLSTDRISAFREAMARFDRAGRRRVVFFDDGGKPVGHVRQMLDVWQNAMRRWAMPEQVASHLADLAGAEAVFSVHLLNEKDLRDAAPGIMAVSYAYTRQRPTARGTLHICHGAGLFDRAMARMREIIASPLEPPRDEWAPGELLDAGI